MIRAAWDLKVQRLEEFAARYLASRLEDYVDEDEFAELIRESASRLKERQETDTIELLDDIRYYLSERFRFRFEGDGLEEMLDEGVGAVDAVDEDALRHDRMRARRDCEATYGAVAPATQAGRAWRAGCRCASSRPKIARYCGTRI